MGYTTEGKQIVIWTEKRSVADPYPNNDCVTNYTYFYKNLKDRKPFMECLAMVPQSEKILLVVKELSLTSVPILRSKKEHYNKIYKR
jgi:hypothetical protein